MGRAKSRTNTAKHGVSFEEAITVFDDPLFANFFDPDHSDFENRFICVGLSRHDRLLVVSYTERGDVLRLISARKATASERDTYEEGY
jgi:uncharacterized DUF497 family protein